MSVSWHQLPKNRAGAYFNLNYNNFVPRPLYDIHQMSYKKVETRMFFKNSGHFKMRSWCFLTHS